MTLEQQLRYLEDQRNAQWRATTHEMIHWKHDLRLAASPTRFIRKHMGVSLMAAALLGLIFAPGSRAQTPHQPRSSQSLLGGLGRLIGHWVPQFRGVTRWASAPAPHPSSNGHGATPPAQPPHHLPDLGTIVRDMLLPLLVSLDWRAIAKAWFTGMRQRSKSDAPAVTESLRPTNAPADPQAATNRPHPPGGEPHDEDVGKWSDRW